MKWFYFLPVFAPLLCLSNSSSQLGSGSLNGIQGRYNNSQVISHYSNSVLLKFPIAFVIQNFPFQHHEPDSGLLDAWGRGHVLPRHFFQFLTWEPREGLVDLPLGTFFFTRWGGEKDKRKKNSCPLPDWSCWSFLFVDYNYFPANGSPVDGRHVFVGGLCWGVSLLHDL